MGIGWASDGKAWLIAYGWGCIFLVVFSRQIVVTREADPAPSFEGFQCGGARYPSREGQDRLVWSPRSLLLRGLERSERQRPAAPRRGHRHP